jgi:hypothetical protein
LGGVGAPEGCEKVPDHILPQTKTRLCFLRKIMESTGFSRQIVFLAEDYGYNTNQIFPQKIVKTG